VRIALPFQTIETVNESVQERQRSLDLFASGREPEWRNQLIWGATLRCENVTLLTGKPWRYLKVPQKEFEKLQPESLGELVVLAAN